jgi:hypothetical protein
LKWAIGSSVEARKTKTLAEIEGSESSSNDSGDGVSRANNDFSHAKVPNDSNYSEGGD